MLKIYTPENKPGSEMEITLMSKRNQVLRKWMQELHNPKSEEDFQQVCLEMSRLAHQRRQSLNTRMRQTGAE